jgi:hypothetical protein
MSTALRIIIPDKSSDADPNEPEMIEIELNRCRLPRCQKLLPPWREFCEASHRSEFHNKVKAKTV